MFRDIQQKKRVTAEKIETVTIFSSDLVNFSELYTDISPFEVWEFYTVCIPNCGLCGRW